MVWDFRIHKGPKIAWAPDWFLQGVRCSSNIRFFFFCVCNRRMLSLVTYSLGSCQMSARTPDLCTRCRIVVFLPRYCLRQLITKLKRASAHEWTCVYVCMCVCVCVCVCMFVCVCVCVTFLQLFWTSGSVTVPGLFCSLPTEHWSCYLALLEEHRLRVLENRCWEYLDRKWRK